MNRKFQLAHSEFPFGFLIKYDNPPIQVGEGECPEGLEDIQAREISHCDESLNRIVLSGHSTFQSSFLIR